MSSVPVSALLVVLGITACGPEHAPDDLAGNDAPGSDAGPFTDGGHSRSADPTHQDFVNVPLIEDVDEAPRTPEIDVPSSPSVSITVEPPPRDAGAEPTPSTQKPEPAGTTPQPSEPAPGITDPIGEPEPGTANPTPIEPEPDAAPEPDAPSEPDAPAEPEPDSNEPEAPSEPEPEAPSEPEPEAPSEPEPQPGVDPTPEPEPNPSEPEPAVNPEPAPEPSPLPTDPCEEVPQCSNQCDPGFTHPVDQNGCVDSCSCAALDPICASCGADEECIAETTPTGTRYACAALVTECAGTAPCNCFQDHGNCTTTPDGLCQCSAPTAACGTCPDGTRCVYQSGSLLGLGAGYTCAERNGCDGPTDCSCVEDQGECLFDGERGVCSCDNEVLGLPLR